MNSSFSEIKSCILEANNIALFAHQRPDGDAIGSVLGLKHIIQENHSASVTPFILDDIPSDFLFLPDADTIRTEYVDASFDLIIILDTANLVRSGLSLEDLVDKKTIIIDHHPTNELFAQYNYVDGLATSVTHILTDFVIDVWWELSPTAATCLMTWLYTDSGSFIHRNTSAHTFEIAAFLTQKWADPGEIAHHVFKSRSFSFQKNFGILMGRMCMYGDVNFCSMIGYEESTGKELKSALVASMNSIQGVRYACVLTQDDTHVRGSLRTNRDDVDVAHMASLYGGWWHAKASGFDFAGRLVREDDVDFIETNTGRYSVEDFLDSFATMTPLT